MNGLEKNLESEKSFQSQLN